MSRSTSLAQIRQELGIIAKYRCGYCLSPEILSGIALTLEHIIPLATGGTDKIDNLWLSCRTCNEKKESKRRPKTRLVERWFLFLILVPRDGRSIFNGIKAVHR